MIDKTAQTQIVSDAHQFKDKFSNCFGCRVRPSLDGSFGSYNTLKYFAMPKSLRNTVKKAVHDLDSNLETYLLRFEEGDRLPMTKSGDECLFNCKSVLLYGEAEVTYKSEVFNMTSGDEIEIEPRYAYQILPKSPCMFLVELQMRKF